MHLPPELAMEVGSYLNHEELKMCIAELCSSGVEFVAAPLSRRVTKVQVDLDELIPLVADTSIEQANVVSMAQQVVGQIDVHLSRHKCRHVEVVVMFATLKEDTVVRDCVNSTAIDNELQSLWHAMDGARNRLAVQWSVRACLVCTCT
jgi:hypothetical protein